MILPPTIAHLNCSCGCTHLAVQRDDEFTYVTVYIPAFFQAGILATIRQRISLAWAIITGRNHDIHDLVVDNIDFNNFIATCEDALVAERMRDDTRD